MKHRVRLPPARPRIRPLLPLLSRRGHRSSLYLGFGSVRSRIAGRWLTARWERDVEGTAKREQSFFDQEKQQPPRFVAWASWPFLFCLFLGSCSRPSIRKTLFVTKHGLLSRRLTSSSRTLIDKEQGKSSRHCRRRSRCRWNRRRHFFSLFLALFFTHRFLFLVLSLSETPPPSSAPNRA